MSKERDIREGLGRAVRVAGRVAQAGLMTVSGWLGANFADRPPLPTDFSLGSRLGITRMFEPSTAYADEKRPPIRVGPDGRSYADGLFRSAGDSLIFEGNNGLESETGNRYGGPGRPVSLLVVGNAGNLNLKIKELVCGGGISVNVVRVEGDNYIERVEEGSRIFEGVMSSLQRKTGVKRHEVAWIIDRDAVESLAPPDEISNSEPDAIAAEAQPCVPAVPEAPARAEARVEVAAVLPPGVPGCPPAEQIGIVPRNKDGTGHMIEFTAARGPLHAQIFLPEGLRPDGQPLVINGQVVGKREMSVVFETGNSWEVVNGAGTGWDYPGIYNTPQCRPVFDAEVTADRGRRAGLTSFFGAVRVEDLVAQGVLRNRRVMLAQQANLAASSVSQAGCPPATFQTENEPFHDVTVGERSSYSVYFKDNNFDLGREVQGTVPASQPARTLLGVAGTTYAYAASCTTEQIQAQVRASAQAAGFRIADIDELIRAGRAR